MKTPWKEVLVALLIGLVVGWFAAGKLQHERMVGWKHGRMLERFSRELNLTPDQKSKVQKIMEDSRTKLEALHTEMGPKFDEIRNASKQEIRAILTPEQTAKFDTLEAKWEAVRQKRRAHWAE